MQHHARAIPHEQQEEQALRHVPPACGNQRQIDRIDGHHAQRRDNVGYTEYVRVTERATEAVLESRLQCPYPFESDNPDDGEREFRYQQRGDLQENPSCDKASRNRAENQPHQRRFREILTECAEIVRCDVPLADDGATSGIMPGCERGADGDDRNAGDKHQDVDPDGVDEVAQPTHEWGIRGQKMHEDSLMSLVLTHPSNRYQQSLSYDAPVGPRLTPSHERFPHASSATPPFTNCLRKHPPQRN